MIPIYERMKKGEMRMKRIIHYDLNSTLTNPSYPDLYDVLEELNYTRITESVCWIDTQLTKQQIFEKIGKVIYASDNVYFISVFGDQNNLGCIKIPSLKK